MITVSVRFPDGEVVYQVDRDERDATSSDPDDQGGDLLLLIVDELLESDGFIGPQVDEYVGAWGNWDHPVNVVAAFMEAAHRTGGDVIGWEFDETEEQAAADAVDTEDDDVA